ncbi:calcium-binding protein [Rhizobium sp. FKL33]|uniref:calcium-binding protein n=1 Tax=Rhizobium sp. FKL33 TaxID=2562307 RepID=UPI0010C11EEF|nr:calcium-binding protein [Rhizobium sp. FKL33]
MATKVVSSENIGSGVRETVAHYGELYVTKTGAIGSTDDYGVFGGGSYATVYVEGTIAGAKSGIRLGDDADSDKGNALYLQASAFIGGSADDFAVEVYGTGNLIENHGTIWSKSVMGDGIFVAAVGTSGETVLANTGLIDVRDTAIRHAGSETLRIENSGVIKGKEAITAVDEGRVLLTNTGVIKGLVTLGDGNDTFDTRKGTFEGVVSGGKGGDTIYGSKTGNNLAGDQGEDTLYGEGGNDYITGNDDADKLYGGAGNDQIDGGAGSDVLKGGSGKDTIVAGDDSDTIDGGAGQDVFYGDGGSDLFVFRLADTGKTAATADTINDFESGDHIGLDLMDANTKVSGNQAFTFIGADAFSGQAGQLRFEKLSSDAFVYGDVNGDKKADFVIHLDDPSALKAGDFIL